MQIGLARMVCLQSILVRSIHSFQPAGMKPMVNAWSMIRMSSSTRNASTSIQSTAEVPRAAVSVVVQHRTYENENRYVLVQRGKEPNKGVWSLPGGKIELGEQSLKAAKRELWEETGLSVEHAEGWNVKWSEDAPICTTDSIHFDPDGEEGDMCVQYHYVISQWFVQIEGAKSSVSGFSEKNPNLVASDDAADANWFSLDDIREGEKRGEITAGVEKVLLRSELMFEKGLL